MTVSNEQLIWLLENDPDFRKQYESIVLAQAYGVQVTQPLQDVPEAPRQTKKRFAGILAQNPKNFRLTNTTYTYIITAHK